MRIILVAVIAVLTIALSRAALAAGGGGGGGGDGGGGGAGGGGGSSEISPALGRPYNPDFAKAKALIQAKHYNEAIPLLQLVVAKDPKDADAYNLMGYATRKSGDPNGSLQYYNQALTIDPKHIGAHEYIGEAYLELDRPQEAAQHLARLDSLCIFGCAEYRMLKVAIADYKIGKKPTN